MAFYAFASNYRAQYEELLIWLCRLQFLPVIKLSQVLVKMEDDRASAVELSE